VLSHLAKKEKEVTASNSDNFLNIKYLLLYQLDPPRRRRGEGGGNSIMGIKHYLQLEDII